MNRTLKFRIWDSDKKVFDYINLYTDNFNAGKYTNPIINQYTGLTDSFGNDIYEGDFVKYSSNTLFGIVVYQVDKFIVKSIGNGFNIMNTADLSKFLDLEPQNIQKTVIGNIIENPNLNEK